MKLTHAASLLLLMALGGCKIRNPFGGCPYEEVELSPQSMTPWDTVLEDDMAALTGPFPGTLAWLDGDDVITVPKAGQTIEVEAEVRIDLSTARMHEYIRGDREAACEPDRLLVDGEVMFKRIDDGDVELTVPITVYRDEEPDQYFAEAETPVEVFAPDLLPMEQHASQPSSPTRGGPTTPAICTPTSPTPARPPTRHPPATAPSSASPNSSPRRKPQHLGRLA